MNNDKILVTQSSMPELDEYVEEIKSIFETKWLTNMGEKHIEFENKLKEYLGVKNITLFVNGHMALYCAIKALKLEGEVITTPFTFVSTTNAIVQNGLTPVFCDIDPDTYTIDVSKIESLITDKTCAIIPVHVYGNVCNVEEIEKIAQKHNLKVIYDAAHAFGVEYKNKGIGNFGDMSMFSFHATKVFNSIEGGAVSFNCDNYKKILNLLKNFGITGPETTEEIGMNAKMNEFQAAMGLCNLRHVDVEIEKRKKIVETYRNRLKNVKGLKLSKEQENVKTNYAYFPIIFEEEFRKTRDEIMEKLAKHNIFTRKYFYPLTTDFECYRNTYNSSETPIAKYISGRVLTLPLFADLSIEKVNEICDIILQ